MGEPTAALLGEYVAKPALTAAYNWLWPEYTRSGDYEPKQWNDWYLKSNLHGTEEFRQHRDYMERALPRLKTRLAEFDPEADLSDPAMVMMVSNVVDSLVGRSYNREDPASNEYRAEFLRWMRDSSLGGDESPDTSVTPEQYAEWGEGTGFVNRENRVSPAGSDALAKLKDYNLFRAFQMGEHMPSAMEAPAMSGPLGVAGVLYGGMTGRSSMSPDPIAMSQIGAANSPSPLNAMRYAVEWDKRGQDADPEYFRDYATGANVQQASIMDPNGMDRSFASGDTLYGQLTRGLTNAIWMNNHNRANRGNLANFMNRADRLTPIGYPADFERDRELRKAGQQIEIDNWAQPATYMPKLLRNTGITPFYGTQAFNDMTGVVPGILGDPGNLAATLLAAPLAGIVARSPRAALMTAARMNLGDVPGEAGFNQAISMSVSPQTPFQYFTEPAPSIPLRTRDGRLPVAALPEYEEALTGWEQKRKDALSSISEQQRIFEMDRKGNQLPQQQRRPSQSIFDSLLNDKPLTNPMSR